MRSIIRYLNESVKRNNIKSPEDLLRLMKSIQYDNTTSDEDYRIKTGDILFSHINSIKHIGKIAIFKSDETLYHGMNLMMIRPSNKVVPDFLFLALSSAKAKRFFESRAKPAINQASLNKSDIETYKYPLPPLKDQLNISERINIVKKEMVILEKKTKSIATLKSHLHSLLYKEVSNELQ